MKTLIGLLIIVAFIQSAVFSLDLVLIILICRSYIRADKANLYLAFAFGLLISHLDSSAWGLQSLIYLVLIAAAGGLAKSRLTGNPLFIVPLSFILVSINQIALSLYLHQSLHLFPKNLFESLLALPILYLVKLWEERFIVKRDIKLRI